MDSDDSLRAAYQSRPDRAPAGEHPSPESIQALARAEGRVADRLVILDHVMACATCRPEFELLRSIHAAGHQEVLPLVPPYRVRIWLPLAAAIALVAGGTYLWQARLNQGEQPVYRDGPAAGGVTLKTPAEGASLDGARQFTWNRVPSANYRFELLDAGGTVAYDRDLADTTVTVPASVALPSGRYSWLVVARLPSGEARSARPRTVIVP